MSSSVYPPSTTEGASTLRISISSTIYPDSAHSFDPASFIHIGSPIPESSDDHNLYYQPPPTSANLLDDIQDEQTIDPDNYQLMSILSGSRVVQPPGSGVPVRD